MSHRIVNTSGAAIQVTESGAGEPSLVFLHYRGGASRTWQDVIDRLGGSMTNVSARIDRCERFSHLILG